MFCEILKKCGKPVYIDDVREKVIKTIGSCKTIDQIAITEKMIINAGKEFKRRGVSLGKAIAFLAEMEREYTKKKREIFRIDMMSITQDFRGWEK